MGIFDVGSTVGVIVRLALGWIDDGQTLLAKDGRILVGQPVGLFVDFRLGFFELGFIVGFMVGLAVDFTVGIPVSD